MYSQICCKSTVTFYSDIVKLYVSGVEVAVLRLQLVVRISDVFKPIFHCDAKKLRWALALA